MKRGLSGALTGQRVCIDWRLQGGISAERLRVVARPGLGSSPLLAWTYRAACT